jgi:hypothetical protein
MTVLRSFTIIVLSALVCASVGSGLGFALGTWAPGLYRDFRNRNDPNFDPVEKGIGLGVTQGLIAGLVIGCVVVLAVTWYESRRHVVINVSETTESPKPSVTVSTAFQEKKP